ncbi:uncharacterized protein [Montipora capricornis]|uniref:uncharacterized protein isoform X1 n=1 Tax=Montipora capricornis TaxID=246305 RepID=UPI0035F1133D
MDNADLEKLSIFPGKLTPKFHPNTTEYSVTLGSDVNQIKIDPLTSDSGASYCISGSGGGKTVILKEGEVTSVKIEVTAEDGSTNKNYFIHVTRLSSSDASLSDLKLSVVTNLCPKFASNVASYSSSVPFNFSSVEVAPVAADKKTAVKINGRDSKETVYLNYGETLVEVEVTSPDGSNKQIYSLLICRNKIPGATYFSDGREQSNFTCPVCLGILHRPKSIKNSDPKHVFCKSCIDELTRTSKRDPLNGTSLDNNWKLEEYDLDKELSSQMVFCVYKHWGCSVTVKLCELGPHVKQCDFRPCVVEKSEELVPVKDLEEKSKEACKGCPDCNRPVRTSEMEEHKMYMCTVKHPTSAVKHKAEIRVWEKKLQQETNIKSVEEMMKTANEQVEECFKVLPQHGSAGHFHGEVSPLRYLEMASEWIASAIKLAPKKADLHFQLGQVLEEQHYVQDLYGIKPSKSSDEEMDFNMKSKESSKEDDIQAICEIRGTGRNAPLSLQLKAIDEEYHYLLDQGQSDKADYVQKLYAWKSKQATQNKTAQFVANEEEPLGKAFMKYMDALSYGLDNHLYNLHVGRMLLLQNKPEEALTRLQVAVGLKPTNVEARFYLGLALCQQKDAISKRTEEAVKYLSEGVEYLLRQITSDSDEPSINPNKWQQTSLSSNNLIRLDNVQWLEGCALLGSICKNFPNVPCGVMSSQRYLHLSSMLATDVMSRLVARGDTYHEVEWILFKSHFQLLQMMLDGTKGKPCGQKIEISRFCENLSSLLSCSNIPPGKQILELQEKICQEAVVLQPCNSRALYRLGDAQLSCHDNDDPTSTNFKQILQDAELSYRASIEQEGSPSVGGEVSPKIAEQLWFKERKAKQKAEKKPVAPESQKAAAPTASKEGTKAGRGVVAAARGRGTAVRGRGNAPSRGAATAASKAPVGGIRGKTSPTKLTGVQARAAARGGGKTTAGKTTLSPSKSSTSTTSSHKSGACSPTKQPTSTKTATSAAKTGLKSPVTPTPEKPADLNPTAVEKASGPLNKATHQPRLGLARVLMRKGGDSISDAQMFYEEVISMAPEVHDAYIELADSCVKSDPMKAVDIYSKYPFKEPLTFDDAYIHGEIVRLLMKNEKYTDPRLGPSMISLGKVMGLTVLEKYVDTLDKTFKYSKLLMEVYAGVHGKSVDDPDLKQFFKFKCWL